LRHENNAAIHSNRAQLERVERSIEKLIEAIKSGIDPTLLKAESDNLIRRKQELTVAPSQSDETPIFVHPAMSHRYHIAMQKLIESFKSPEQHEKSAELVRGLIERIIMTPNAELSDLAIDLHGDLAG
jgi:site-specific DNA recombinase